jgi:hypothetical protein
MAFRLERLEQGQVSNGPVHMPDAEAGSGEPAAEPQPEPEPVPVPVGAPSLELTQLQEAWTHTVLPAVEERGGIPTASLLREAHPAELSGDTLTLEFPPSADFHRKLAEEKYKSLLRDALYEVTGRKLELEFALGEHGEEPGEEEPASEEDLVALVKETFDAREVDD